MTAGSFQGTAARVLAMVLPGAVLSSAAKADSRILGLAEQRATCREQPMGGRKSMVEMDRLARPFSGLLVASIGKVRQAMKGKGPVVHRIARTQAQSFVKVRPCLVALAAERVVSAAPHISEGKIGIDLESGL